MDETKANIDLLYEASKEFDKYLRASHVNPDSPLSRYCETRAIMAACDMALYAARLKTQFEDKSETIRDKGAA